LVEADVSERSGVSLGTQFFIFAEIFFLCAFLFVQPLTAQNKGFHLSSFFGYPLTVGDAKTEQLHLSINKLVPIDVVTSFFTVTFFFFEGHPEGIHSNVQWGSTISEPPRVPRSGYTLDGWYREREYINKWNFSGDKVTGDTRLYAKWTPLTTGAEDFWARNLNVYPNPFRDAVRITGADVGVGLAPAQQIRQEQGQALSLRIRVVNAFGATVHTQQITSLNETIRLEHLPEGVYFFVFENDGKTKTIKTVKE
jgi:uncharacterized repeat protein (TIGR02543 family)